LSSRRRASASEAGQGIDLAHANARSVPDWHRVPPSHLLRSSSATFRTLALWLLTRLESDEQQCRPGSPPERHAEPAKGALGTIASGAADAPVQHDIIAEQKLDAGIHDPPACTAGAAGLIPEALEKP